VGWAKQLIISDRTHLFEQFHGELMDFRSLTVRGGVSPFSLNFFFQIDSCMSLFISLGFSIINCLRLFAGSTKEQGYRVLADNFSLGRIPQEAHRPQQEQAHQAEELVGEFS